MTFEKAVDELKKGKKIHRVIWPDGAYIVNDCWIEGNVQSVNGNLFLLSDLLKDDWEAACIEQIQDAYGYGIGYAEVKECED